MCDSYDYNGNKLETMIFMRFFDAYSKPTDHVCRGDKIDYFPPKLQSLVDVDSVG